MIPGSDGMVFPKVNSARKPVQKDGVTLATRISEMDPSGTSFVRIRSEYADASSTASHPSERDGGLFFSGTDATDLEISGYGNQSAWTITYYDAQNNVMGTPQTYKTRARANTIAELRTQKWAALDDSSLGSLKAKFVANTATAPKNNSYTKLPSSGLAEPGWSVPSGALPPTSVTLYGKGPADVNDKRASFADAQSVGSTKRSSKITCANGSGENHCVAGGTGYTVGAFMTGLHLWARDPSGREYASFYATYNLN